MTKLSYRAAVDFLFNLERSGVKLGLDTTYGLLDVIGNPHESFRSVHIAGTNGKGSVACFLNSILFHNGLTSGLFTSPHLVSYRERIRTDGQCISRGDLSRLVSDLRDHIVSTRVSYFEATTVLAFEHFRRKQVDVAVIEVGMGGRLDSTNVLNPLISCITSIDFDHVVYLGNTITRIAGEKAGIIKTGVPVVCGPLLSQASRKIRRCARAGCAPVFELGKDATVRPIETSIEGSAFEYRGLGSHRVLEIRSPGLHQITNAAVAVLVAEVLSESGVHVSDKAIETGLKAAFWPGRLHVLRHRPLIVCDAAHNVSGARALRKALASVGFRSDITVFAVLRDKDYPKMLALLAGFSDSFVLTKPDSPRALPLCKLKAAARHASVNFKAFGTVDRALEHAIGRAPAGGNILICGSLYALGEAMQFLRVKPCLTNVC
jgi:dihydrofolate synthase/folylpolyglutamate synthase